MTKQSAFMRSSPRK